MSVICPTVTPSTDSPHDYRQQMDRISSFATRIQVDLMDGDFAKPKTINPIQAWWPEGMDVDMHLMFRRPLEHLETLVSLNPSLVIIHAEAEGNLLGIIEHFHKLKMRAGVALLQETTVVSVRKLIEAADHVLIFSGVLGSFGGQADFKQLDKVAEIRAINPHIEIGWDGGAKVDNIQQLAEGGIDVINVGGAIQRAEHPQRAYDTLVQTLNG